MPIRSQGSSSLSHIRTRADDVEVWSTSLAIVSILYYTSYLMHISPACEGMHMTA